MQHLLPKSLNLVPKIFFLLVDIGTYNGLSLGRLFKKHLAIFYKFSTILMEHDHITFSNGYILIQCATKLAM